MRCFTSDANLKRAGMSNDVVANAQEFAQQFIVEAIGTSYVPNAAAAMASDHIGELLGLWP